MSFLKRSCPENSSHKVTCGQPNCPDQIPPHSILAMIVEMLGISSTFYAIIEQMPPKTPHFQSQMPTPIFV